MEARRDALGRAAHDLRNPLAVVRAALEWLEAEGASASDSETADALRDASAAVAQLAAIVEDLAMLAHVERREERGAASGTTAPYERASSLVAEAVAACDGRARSARAVVSVDVPEDIFVVGERPQVVLALEVFLGTILRGSPRGVEVRVSARADEAQPDRVVFVMSASFRGAPLDADVDFLAGASLAALVAERVVAVHGGSVASRAGEIVVVLPRRPP